MKQKTNWFIKAVVTISVIVATNSLAQTHPAQLKITNSSQRYMQIKVMTLSGQKYSENSVGANSTVVIPVYQTGYYYLKTKATSIGVPPICKKDDAFQVTVSSQGYSVLEIVYSIEEAAVSAALTGGRQISDDEFENDKD